MTEDKAGKVEEVREQMKRDKSKSLHINRVPEKTLNEFRDLAHDEFEGDYGMTLKWLFDLAMRFSPRVEQLESVIINHEKRLDFIENGGDTEEGDAPETISTVGGNELVVGGGSGGD